MMGFPGEIDSVWLAKNINSWLPSINKQYTFRGCAVFFLYKQRNQNVYALGALNLGISKSWQPG